MTAITDEFEKLDPDNDSSIYYVDKPEVAAFDKASRHYNRAIFTFGPGVRMARTGFLAPIIFADATFTCVRWWTEQVKELVSDYRARTVLWSLLPRAFMTSLLATLLLLQLGDDDMKKLFAKIDLGRLLLLAGKDGNR
jgi:hypothetical protein